RPRWGRLRRGLSRWRRCARGPGRRAGCGRLSWQQASERIFSRAWVWLAVEVHSIPPLNQNAIQGWGTRRSPDWGLLLTPAWLVWRFVLDWEGDRGVWAAMSCPLVIGRS